MDSRVAFHATRMRRNWDALPTDHVLAQGPVVRLDPLKFCSVPLNQVEHAFAAGEHLGRGNCGLRLHEYADEARAVLLGEYAGELQNARSLGAPIDEDHDFPQLSGALANAQGGRLRRRPRRLLICHSHSSFSSCVPLTRWPKLENRL